MKFSNVLFLLGILSGSATLAQSVSTGFSDIHPFQSQSLIRILNADGEPGMIQIIPSVTTDFKLYTPGSAGPTELKNQVVLYDKRNPLPEMSRVGVNFAFYEGGYFTTSSADGFLYYLGKQDFTPAESGGVYFVKKGTREIAMVNSYGTAFFYTGMYAPAIRMTGGNYFISEDNVLTTFKSSGISNGADGYVGMMTTYSGIEGQTPPRFPDAYAAGGNFFFNKDGTIVTINSITGGYSGPFMPDSRPQIMGGNYYIGQDSYLYTVANNGNSYKNFKLESRPKSMGYSYIIFHDNSFLMIDGFGQVHSSLVRVKHDGSASVMDKIPGEVNPKANYLPNFQQH